MLNYKMTEKRKSLLEDICKKELIYFSLIKDRRSFHWLEKNQFVSTAFSRKHLTVVAFATDAGRLALNNSL